MGTKRLHKMVALVLAATASGPAFAQVTPPDLSGIMNNYNSVIQQQNLGTQLNNLQLQQNLQSDRIREFELFRPQTPYGAGAVFQPQPTGVDAWLNLPPSVRVNTLPAVSRVEAPPVFKPAAQGAKIE
jgi:hypothetical protein